MEEPPAHDANYACVHGRIKVVLHDRETARRHVRRHVSSISPDENYVLVVIPPGVWHGFQGVATPLDLGELRDRPTTRRLDRLEARSAIPYTWSGLVSTVLVTGAGGFVGSAVVRRLTQPGTRLWDGSRVEHVVAMVRPEGTLDQLEDLTVDHPWSVARVDAYDERSFRESLRRVRPRAVVDAALDGAVFSGSAIGHAPLESVFAELATKDGARYVHAGSAWVLAPGLNLDESAAVEPRSPYARGRAEEDELLPETWLEDGCRLD